MHMPDALVSPAVGIAFYAISGAAVQRASTKIKSNPVNPGLLGVMAGFVFASQMINYSIPGTGSSGHIGGGILLASVLGPHAAMLAMTAVLIVQALFFADGGLLSLGCNIFNMGVIPILLVYPFIEKIKDRSYLLVLSIVIALLMGASMVTFMTLLSGKAQIPMTSFLSLMLGIHLPIGVIEGLITVGLLRMLSKVDTQGRERVKPLVPIAVGAVFIATIVAWFASSSPDGLEWSLGKTSFKEETPKGIEQRLQKIQEGTSFLPDYGFKTAPEEEKAEEGSEWGKPNMGTSVSGLVGTVIVLTLSTLLAYLLGRMQLRKNRPSAP